MNTTIVTRISIAASPAEVFEYLTNLEYHYLWNPQVHSISTKEQLKLGSEFETTSLVLGVKIKAKNVVTKFIPPKEIEMENNIGAVSYHASFRLAPKGKMTMVVLTTTVSTDSHAFAFTVPILKKLARRELQTDMQALKLAVENQLE